MLTYIKINIIISIFIIAVTVIESDKECSAPIHMWLMVYVSLTGLDSFTKLIALRFNRTQFTCIKSWQLDIMFEFIIAGWLIYGNSIFVQQSEECIEQAPLISYTFLFVLIIGFISLAKFAVIILAILIWVVSKLAGADIPFEQIFNDAAPAQYEGVLGARANAHHGATDSQIDRLEMKHFGSFKTRGFYEDYKDDDYLYQGSFKQSRGGDLSESVANFQTFQQACNVTATRNISALDTTSVNNLTITSVNRTHGTPKAQRNSSYFGVPHIYQSCSICFVRYRDRDVIKILPCHQ
mmetsp:Transcript_26971/g.26043  ORF Transcript_26971/g.26043 Transcript_26971/m.26043 type:complete len:295 (+) Transcript_26971:618-1502(+)